MEHQRAAKRQRFDGAADLDTLMSRTREQLMRTTDSHLQAKLLLEFSHQSISSEGKTEAAIDFLFSFLQHGAKDSDATTAEATSDTRSNGGGNPVVVGAVVRGLRQVLSVKPECVEPMVQSDAMSEQLMQCISVPEDCKLRRDMLSIVLDCLFNNKSFTAIEGLLSVCVKDHDDRMQSICVQAYSRLLGHGHQFNTPAVEQLLDRLSSILADGDEESRVLTVKLLGQLLDAQFDPPRTPLRLRPLIIHALAVTSRDSSHRVRREVASNLRYLVGVPQALYSQLLQKKQVSEQLVDISIESRSMLASGAVLTLLEDSEDTVVVEMSVTMQILAEGCTWSVELLDRIITSCIDVLGSGGRDASAVVAIVRCLGSLLVKREQTTGEAFDLSREELAFVLGRAVRFGLQVARPMLKVLQCCVIDHKAAASSVERYLTQCCETKTRNRSMPTTPDAVALRSALRRVAGKLSALGVTLSEDTQRVLVDSKSQATPDQHSRGRELVGAPSFL